MESNIKAIADQVVSRSQALLVMDGYVNPVIFEVNGNTITPTENMSFKTDRDRLNAVKVLHEMSTRSEAIILLMDVWIKHLSKADLKLDPNLMETSRPEPALLCTLYTPNETQTRVIIHTETGKPIFDKGWEIITSDGGYLHNPYQTNESENIEELF